MPDVLNQDEVDALLDLVKDPSTLPAALPAAAGRPSAANAFNLLPPGIARPYDFKRPERVPKEGIAALAALHEAFARNVSASLSGYLRTAMEVRLDAVEQVTYSEFTVSLPSPTSLHLLSCVPLEGNAILEMNPSIIFPVIDRLLGGGSSEAYLLNRPFTAIEQGLVTAIAGRILDQLSLTWENLDPIRFGIVESESNPFLMQVLAPNEPIVLFRFEAVLGEYSGMLNFCIPFKAIEPVIGRFSKSPLAPREAPSRDARDRILADIASANVEIAAVLADIPIRLCDLLTMKPGDILDTGKPAGSDLVLAIGEERKFLGKAGLSNGKIAFRITRAGSRPEA